MDYLNELQYSILESYNHDEISINQKDLLLEFVEIKMSSIANDYLYEAYIGKSSTLLHAEKVLGKMMQEMRVNPLADYDNHPLNQELCKLLQEQFGFKEVILHWVRSRKSCPVCATLCDYDVFARATRKMAMSKTHKGYYDTNHKHMCFVYLSSTLPSQIDLTAEEYLAIILHEIGHNFDVSPYMIISMIINLITLILSAINTMTPKIIPTISPDGQIENIEYPGQVPIREITMLLANTAIGKKINGIFGKVSEWILSYVPVLKKIGNILNTLVDFISTTFEYVFLPLNLVSLPIAILNSPISQVKTLLTRKGEQFADSFATMYGFGPYLISALNKMDTTNLLKSKDNELVNVLTDLAICNRYIITACCGGHGTSLDRLNISLTYLKRELNSSDIDNRVKASINKQIKDLEKIRDQLTNVNNDQQFVLSCAVRAFTNKFFGGDTGYVAALLDENLVK